MFETFPISEVCLLISRGISPAYDDEGIPVLSQKCVRDNRVIMELARITNPKIKKVSSEKLICLYDVLVNSTGVGTLGRVAQVKKLNGQVTVDSHVSIVRPDQSKVDPLFFGYTMVFNQPKIESMGEGATGQTELSRTRLGMETFIPLPPLPVQRRIAGILSAYDDLIENNQRRIAILERMARALYREWFVHFRYPGHEGVPFVASPLGEIPQGWEVKTVANSFEILGGGTPSRNDERYWEGGTIQWFSPSDLTSASTMFMDDSGDHITELGYTESSARLFPAQSVMLTSRATIGAIAINTHEACTNQGFITCLPNERVPLYFLFHWVKENVPTFQRMASGATFKEISRGVFKTIEFLLPSKEITEKFEVTVAPIGKQLLTLQRQIQNLRRTRDLLLPRLLAGQLDVGELDDA